MNVFRLSAVPGVTLVGNGGDSSMFSIGLVGASDKNIYALQYSTFINIVSNNLYGLQDSGIFNIAGQVHGAQVTGLFNCAGNVTGAQAAGLFNTAKDVNGAQLAGLFNTASEVNGIQMAGLFNSARHVNGVQLGVINIADSSDGIAIGVINIIKDGMHHIGFNWDTNGMFDIFFQSGTKHLFITIGMASDNQDFWSDRDWEDYTRIYYGGFGTEFRFGFSSIDLEFLGKFVYNRNELPHTDNEAYSYNFGQLFIPSFRVTFNPLSLRHIDLSLGASFDIHNHGVNDTAFAYTYHRFGDDDNETSVHPAVFIGFKIK